MASDTSQSGLLNSSALPALADVPAVPVVSVAPFCYFVDKPAPEASWWPLLSDQLQKKEDVLIIALDNVSVAESKGTAKPAAAAKKASGKVATPDSVTQSAVPAAPQPLTEAQSKDVKDRIDAAVAARSKALKDSFEATRATLSAELTALGAVAAATSAPQSDGKKPSKPVAKPVDAKARPTSAAKNTVVAVDPAAAEAERKVKIAALTDKLAALKASWTALPAVQPLHVMVVGCVNTVADALVLHKAGIVPKAVFSLTPSSPSWIVDLARLTTTEFIKLLSDTAAAAAAAVQEAAATTAKPAARPKTATKTAPVVTPAPVEAAVTSNPFAQTALLNDINVAAGVSVGDAAADQAIQQAELLYRQLTTFSNSVAQYQKWRATGDAAGVKRSLVDTQDSGSNATAAAADTKLYRKVMDQVPLGVADCSHVLYALLAQVEHTAAESTAMEQQKSASIPSSESLNTLDAYMQASLSRIASSPSTSASESATVSKGVIAAAASTTIDPVPVLVSFGDIEALQAVQLKHASALTIGGSISDATLQQAVITGARAIKHKVLPSAVEPFLTAQGGLHLPSVQKQRLVAAARGVMRNELINFKKPGGTSRLSRKLLVAPALTLQASAPLSHSPSVDSASGGLTRSPSLTDGFRTGPNAGGVNATGDRISAPCEWGLMQFNHALLTAQFEDLIESIFNATKASTDNGPIPSLATPVPSTRLFERTHKWQLSPAVLRQQLQSGTHLPHLTTVAKFAPLEDALLVACAPAAETLTAEPVLWTGGWSRDLSLPQWLQSADCVKSHVPSALFDFGQLQSSGRLAHLRRAVNVTASGSIGCFVSFDGKFDAASSTSASTTAVCKAAGLKDDQVEQLAGLDVVAAAAWLEDGGTWAVMQPESREQPAQVRVVYPDQCSVTCSGSTLGGSFALACTSLHGLTVKMSVAKRSSGMFQQITQVSPAGGSRAAGTVASTSVAETQRSYLPTGEVIVTYADGSVTRLCWNGASQRATAAGVCVYTAPDGTRSQWSAAAAGDALKAVQEGVPAAEFVTLLPAIHSAKQTDVESGAIVLTREDLCLVIYYKNGSSYAQHPDGTRIYCDVSGLAGAAVPAPVNRIFVDVPAYAPVTFNGCAFKPSGDTVDVLLPCAAVNVSVPTGDGAIMTYDASSTFYTVTKNDMVSFEAPWLCTDGVGRCLLGFETRGGSLERAQTQFSSSQCCVYELAYTNSAPFIRYCNAADGVWLAGTDGRIRRNGAAMTSPAVRQPRLFVVETAGSGFELLPSDAAKRLQAQAELCSSTIRRVPLELPAESKSVRSIEPCMYLYEACSSVAINGDYHREPIIPSVLKVASGFAFGSSAPTTKRIRSPDVFLHLQLFPQCPAPVTEAQFKKLVVDMQLYRDQKAKGRIPAMISASPSNQRLPKSPSSNRMSTNSPATLSSSSLPRVIESTGTLSTGDNGVPLVVFEPSSHSVDAAEEERILKLLLQQRQERAAQKAGTADGPSTQAAPSSAPLLIVTTPAGGAIQTSKPAQASSSTAPRSAAPLQTSSLTQAGSTNFFANVKFALHFELARAVESLIMVAVPPSTARSTTQQPQSPRQKESARLHVTTLGYTGFGKTADPGLDSASAEEAEPAPKELLPIDQLQGVFGALKDCGQAINEAASWAEKHRKVDWNSNSDHKAAVQNAVFTLRQVVFAPGSLDDDMIAPLKLNSTTLKPTVAVAEVALRAQALLTAVEQWQERAYSSSTQQQQQLQHEVEASPDDQPLDSTNASYAVQYAASTAGRTGTVDGMRLDFSALQGTSTGIVDHANADDALSDVLSYRTLTGSNDRPPSVQAGSQRIDRIDFDLSINSGKIQHGTDYMHRAKHLPTTKKSPAHKTGGARSPQSSTNTHGKRPAAALTQPQSYGFSVDTAKGTSRTRASSRPSSATSDQLRLRRAGDLDRKTPRTPSYLLDPPALAALAPPATLNPETIAIQPAHGLDFGTVKAGHTYRLTFSITNKAAQAARVHFLQPASQAPEAEAKHGPCKPNLSDSAALAQHNVVRVLYRPGMLASGMTVRCEAELYAGHAATFQDAVLLNTGIEQVVFPVTAEVEPDSSSSDEPEEHNVDADAASHADQGTTVTVLPPIRGATNKAGAPSSPTSFGKIGHPRLIAKGAPLGLRNIIALAAPAPSGKFATLQPRAVLLSSTTRH